jgi:hypothetical protein
MSSSTGFAFDPIGYAPKQSREDRSNDNGSRWMTAVHFRGGVYRADATKSIVHFGSEAEADGQ